MKFICEKEKLLSAIIPAMYGVSAGATIPVLEGIQVAARDSELVICGYDLEKGVRARCDARVTEKGSTVFNGAQLVAIVKGLGEGEINVSVDEKGLATITQGRATIDIHTRSDETFPELPRLSGERTVVIKQGLFKRMSAQVMFAIANNEAKPTFNGMFVKCENARIIAAALDGYKLAYREHSFVLSSEDTEFTFIIPGKSLTELLKLMTKDDDENINLELTRKHIIVNFGDVTFFSRLIDGEFINYERFIPYNNKTFITLDTDKLISAAERAALIINEKAKTPIVLNVGNGRIAVSCVSINGRFFDEIEADIEGEDVEIAFNVRYLLDTLRACPEKVHAELSTPRTSMVITPIDAGGEDERFIYLVVPVMK